MSACVLLNGIVAVVKGIRQIERGRTGEGGEEASRIGRAQIYGNTNHNALYGRVPRYCYRGMSVEVDSRSGGKPMRGCFGAEQVYVSRWSHVRHLAGAEDSICTEMVHPPV